jgi:hypothetical protein
MKRKLLTMTENTEQQQASVRESRPIFPDGFFAIWLIRNGWRPLESAAEEENPDIFPWNLILLVKLLWLRINVYGEILSVVRV